MADYRSKPRNRHKGAPGEPVIQPYNEKARPELKWRVKFKLKDEWKSRKFRLKKDAQTFHNEKVAEFRNLGVKNANVLSESLKREAINAQELLGDLSLLEAAQHYREYIQRTSDGQTITKLIPSFLNHLRDERGVSHRHLNDVDGRLNRFAESFGSRHPAAIGANEVADWLGNLKVSVKPKATQEREILDEELSVQSRRHYRAVLRNFFAWCIDNDYCSIMPIRGKPPRIREVAAPSIWTPAELAQVIQVLLAWNPGQTKSTDGKRQGNYPTKVPEKMDILANVVICAFAGLRQSEFERLHWEHVYLEHNVIDLSEITTKNTPSNRHITIRPTLRAWLEAYFTNASGPCLQPNFPNRLAAFRNHLRANGIEWQPNVLRHSYASYMMGELKDAQAVASQMGHIGQGTLYKHYSKPVYRDQATEYWKLMPDKLRLAPSNNSEGHPEEPNNLSENLSEQFSPDMWESDYKLASERRRKSLLERVHVQMKRLGLVPLEDGSILYRFSDEISEGKHSFLRQGVSSSDLSDVHYEAMQLYESLLDESEILSGELLSWQNDINKLESYSGNELHTHYWDTLKLHVAWHQSNGIDEFLQHKLIRGLVLDAAIEDVLRCDWKSKRKLSVSTVKEFFIDPKTKKSLLSSQTIGRWRKRWETLGYYSSPHISDTLLAEA